jgi:tetratricopeptide (TPR) repeat protein
VGRAKKAAKRAVPAKKKSAGKESAARSKPVRSARTAAKKTPKKAAKKAVKVTKSKTKKVARKATKVTKKATKKMVKKGAKKAPPPKKSLLKKVVVRRPVFVRPTPVKKKVKLKSSVGALQAQQKVYAKGVDLLNLRKYSQAATRFGKATDGPNTALGHSASVYLKICRQRTENETQPKTAEDRYNAAIALINDRRLDEAKRLLGLAVKQEPKGAHMHYALAVASTLSGDVADGVDSLSRAIELDPQSRVLALGDSDLAELRSDPAGADLLSDVREERDGVAE